jgi:hypothetical protein
MPGIATHHNTKTGCGAEVVIKGNANRRSMSRKKSMARKVRGELASIDNETVDDLHLETGI